MTGKVSENTKIDTSRFCKKEENNGFSNLTL